MAGGTLYLLCLLGGLKGPSDPAEMGRVVMEGTKQGLAQGSQSLAAALKEQKDEPSRYR